jgi:hypothetical protein
VSRSKQREATGYQSIVKLSSIYKDMPVNPPIPAKHTREEKLILVMSALKTDQPLTFAQLKERTGLSNGPLEKVLKKTPGINRKQVSKLPRQFVYFSG